MRNVCLIQEPRNQREACVSIRKYLIGAPGLHPLTLEGRRDRFAYLEHGPHGVAIVLRLLEEFALPPQMRASIEVKVHARYDTARSPPDEFELRSSVAVPPIVIHLWNWTGAGTSGFHYDGLVAELPRPEHVLICA